MKNTRTPHAPSGFCPRYHRAVELIGRRWSGTIIRALMAGRRRFSDLAAAVPGISDRLLCERLRELEAAAIVQRIVHEGPPLRVDYELTGAGMELDATVRTLAAWAERWMPAQRSKKRALT